MRAILLAAGMGRRLRPYTDDRPKCLVPVRGRPMLAWQVDALVAAGVRELVIVRGYRGDVLEREAASLPVPVRFVDNLDYQRSNILGSLMCAVDAVDGAGFVSYADIVYGSQVACALPGAGAELALAVDREYHVAYAGRTEHPLAEAELCQVDGDGQVVNVGKRAVAPEHALGEFIGLMWMSAAGAARVRDACERVDRAYRERDHEPFARAAAYRDAYLTDLLQDMIGGGTRIDAIGIDGGWREIDTTQDLERAERDGW